MAQYPVYHRIFVSLDGSPAQEQVLDRAIALACTHRATLIIGHVIDVTTFETTGVFPIEIIDSLEEAFLQSIDPLLTVAQDTKEIHGIEVLVKSGRIRETLMDEMIKPTVPDLIICGARGLSPIKYALLGSISSFLLRNSPCDILVVK